MSIVLSDPTAIVVTVKVPKAAVAANTALLVSGISGLVTRVANIRQELTPIPEVDSWDIQTEAIAGDTVNVNLVCTALLKP